MWFLKCLRPKILTTANTLNLWLKLYIHHLYLVFSIFCIHKTNLYNLIFVFRIEQIDKCLVIFISYEIKSNVILVIFREWLILSHLYLLVFAILIIFHIFWLFITTTHTIDWLYEYCELFSAEIALLHRTHWKIIKMWQVHILDRRVQENGLEQDSWNEEKEKLWKTLLEITYRNSTC